MTYKEFYGVHYCKLQEAEKMLKDMLEVFQKNEEMVRSELKRCADEIASIDLSMQTIKDLIFMN